MALIASLYPPYATWPVAVSASSCSFGGGGTSKLCRAVHQTVSCREGAAGHSRVRLAYQRGGGGIGGLCHAGVAVKSLWVGGWLDWALVGCTPAANERARPPNINNAGVSTRHTLNWPGGPQTEKSVEHTKEKRKNNERNSRGLLKHDRAPPSAGHRAEQNVNGSKTNPLGEGQRHT